MRMSGLVLAISAFATASTLAQTSRPALTIVQPEEDVILSGLSRFEAAVTPASTEVRRVTFFVDGQQACRVETKPLQCEWDAGSRPEPRNLRVVAEMVDGRRLVATRRTRPRGLTFAASTDAVLVPARVVDSRGNFVQGLTADQFVLFEDGEQQEVMSVLAEDAPASVVLALDMSASMQPKMADLRRAATRFLESVRPYDQVSVTAFNQNLSVLTRPDADEDARRAALAQIKPWGGTALYDSLIRGTEMLRSQPSPRVLVAFTDGEDVDSVASVQRVRSTLQGADVVLYLVVGSAAPSRNSPTATLARVAEETGGSAWFTPRMDTLGDRFSAIVNDLTNGYVLLYMPQRPLGDGAWRELRVEIAGSQGRDHAVRARQGYLATGRTR